MEEVNKIKLYILEDGKVVNYVPTDENGEPVNYTEIEVEDYPVVDNKPLYDGELYYLDGVFITKFTINPNKVYGAINDKKAKLKETDYQALKMWESEKLGEPEPYNVSVLQDRQIIRDEINRLEGMIS